MRTSIQSKNYLILLVSLLISFPSCHGHSDSMPILILANQADFGLYTGEILKAEGFNGFKLKSPSDKSITESFLEKYVVVILSHQKIDSDLTERLKEYVSDGGNLIAFQPDEKLYELFGISANCGQLQNGYVAVDTNTLTGKGLPCARIQIHGSSAMYKLNSGISLAELCNDSGNSTGYPGLISHSWGSGIAYAFSYNLPENVVLTRQGNPMAAGLEKDGINGIRAMDLFTGGWQDTSKNRINQADVHMNMLSRCIETPDVTGKPLPRLWYFPDNLKSLVTLTNDGEYKEQTDFETQFSDLESANAKMTLYILETDKVSKDWVNKWSSRGFELSGHPDDTREANDPQWSNMDSAVSVKKKELITLSGKEMQTVVNHWFVWCGKDSSGNPEFAAQAMIEEKNSLGMDINYAHYDMGSVEGHFLGTPGYNQGNYNGSGLPMKFATSKGQVLNLYQHLNNVYDQQYMELKDPEGFFQCFKGLMDRSLNHETYSFINIKSHNDEYFFSKVPLLKMIAYANERGIPVWTAEKLLEFLKVKDDAVFIKIEWNGKKLMFTLSSTLSHESGLTFMVPATFGNASIFRIMIDHQAFPYEKRQFKGKEYAFITVKPGNTYHVIAEYK